MKLFILLVTATIVASRSSHASVKDGQNNKDVIVQNFKKLKEMLLERIKSTRSEETTTKDDRTGKNINYYSLFPQSVIPYPYFQNKNLRPVLPEEWLSRTEPFKRKTNHLIDSPTYYIRLPPNPYIYVPGVGYISRPPSLADPEVIPEKQNEIIPDQFYHLPLDFTANGKPTSVQIVRPKPEPPVLSLNKGPYLFNGKPSEVYLLRNSLNSLYADALTNFYP